MNDKTETDNSTLIEFWNKAFLLSNDDRERYLKDPDGWKNSAPSQKLFSAAASLGKRSKVLDYGCGHGWASVIAAKHGCPDITAVDVSENGVKATDFLSGLYGVSDQIHTRHISPDWIFSVPDSSYDGFFCSNVLDVIPPETSERIIRESARIVTDDATVIISLNYWMSPEKAAERKTELQYGNRVYVDGVLRLVSFTDEEWFQRLSPYYTVEKLEHFAWPHEAEETRRLFYLRKKR